MGLCGYILWMNIESKSGDMKKQTWKESFLLIGSVFGVVLIGYLDNITGEEISIYIYYALPIAVSSWFVGNRAGYITAVASALAWFLVDFRGDSGIPVLHVWNVFVRLTFFVSMAFILSTLKATLELQKELASQDPLTGLSNRRAFFEIAEFEIKRLRRYARPLTLAYMDLDDFKAVNDQKGHEEGDRLLISVAEALRRCTRVTDAIARLGGDEFVVLLPETGEEAAFTAVQKFHQEILEVMREHGWPVTLSVGALTFNDPPETVDEMLRIADQLMYLSKKGGKNSIKFKLYNPKIAADFQFAAESQPTPNPKLL